MPSSLWPLLLLLTTTLAHPTALTQRACPNHLANPSFESASSPWLTIVTSAWSTRGIYPSLLAHSGSHTYYALSNSTIESTLTLSQSSLALRPGSDVECYVWISSRRGEGETSVEVFLDGERCGAGVFGEGVHGWRKVGGRVRVRGGVEGVGSTVAVVATSERAGEEGWEVWVDDAGVVGC